MGTSELKYRMYGLVPYNLSPIQQGIQFGHAVVEYMLDFPIYLKVYQDARVWAEKDKTFIILNGGTTNSQPMIGTNEPIGTLNKHLDTLMSMGIRCARFLEPDLGNQLTAVVFLVDERVWDYEKYPTFEKWARSSTNKVNSIQINNSLNAKIEFPEAYNEWKEFLGGEQNVNLREFLKQFKLA